MAKPITVLITGDTSGLSKAVGQADGMFGKLGAAGGAAALAIGSAAVVAGGILVGIGMQADEMRSNIIKGTGASGDALEGLFDSAKSVLTTVPDSGELVSNTLADVNTFFGATGDELEDLTESFLDFARVTGVDTTAAIGSLDAAFVQFGEDSNVDEALGDLLRISQATGAPMATLLSQMETFGPLFANAGFSIEETNAVFGQLEQAGISITRLGPGLNKFFRDMAAEGKDPKEALAAVVEEMQNAGTSAEALTLATAAFGAEGAQRMTTAVRSGNFDLKDFNGLLGEGTGLVGEQANATETFGQKWAVVKNRVFVALEPLATKLFNAIKVGMDAIGPAIETVSRLFVIFKEDGIEGLSAAIEQKFGPNSVVTRTFKAFVTFFEDAQKVISEEVVPRIKGALEALSNIINGILIAIMALWDVFGDTILDAITDTFEFIKSAIDAALKIIKGIVDTFIGIFTGDWQLAWDGIKSIFKGIVDSFAAVFTFAWERLKTVVRLGLNAIRALWNLGFLQAGVRRAIDAVVTYFRKLPGRLRSLTKAVFRAAKSVGAKVVSGIISGIRGGIGAVASIATTIANSLVTIINTKIIDNINRALEFRIELFGVGRDINPPDIPHIPGLATGGIMGRGGNVVVGERGKEIVSLPAGARVEPNHGARMDEGGGITVNVQTQADPFQIANAIAWRMRTRGA